MSEPRLNRRYVLRERPLELPDDSHFSVESTPIPSPGEGEVLVKTLLVALSPWQNQRLKDFKNYTRPFAIGELIDCDVLGEVTVSNCAEIEPGQLVTGRLGWQEWAVTTAQKVILIDDEFAPELWLTALSSPGFNRVRRDGSLWSTDARPNASRHLGSGVGGFVRRATRASRQYECGWHLWVRI